MVHFELTQIGGGVSFFFGKYALDLFIDSGFLLHVPVAKISFCFTSISCLSNCHIFIYSINWFFVRSFIIYAKTIFSFRVAKYTRAMKRAHKT